MVKWEYKVVFVANDFEEKLNELGFNGWELVGLENIMVINKTLFILKRPLPEGAISKEELDKWFNQNYPNKQE